MENILKSKHSAKIKNLFSYFTSNSFNFFFFYIKNLKIHQFLINFNYINFFSLFHSKTIYKKIMFLVFFFLSLVFFILFSFLRNFSFFFFPKYNHNLNIFLSSFSLPHDFPKTFQNPNKPYATIFSENTFNILDLKD